MPNIFSFEPMRDRRFLNFTTVTDSYRDYFAPSGNTYILLIPGTGNDPTEQQTKHFYQACKVVQKYTTSNDPYFLGPVFVRGHYQALENLIRCDMMMKGLLKITAKKAAQPLDGRGNLYGTVTDRTTFDARFQRELAHYEERLENKKVAEEVKKELKEAEKKRREQEKRTERMTAEAQKRLEEQEKKESAYKAARKAAAEKKLEAEKQLKTEKRREAIKPHESESYEKRQAEQKIADGKKLEEEFFNRVKAEEGIAAQKKLQAEKERSEEFERNAAKNRKTKTQGQVFGDSEVDAEIKRRKEQWNAADELVRKAKAYDEKLERRAKAERDATRKQKAAQQDALANEEQWRLKQVEHAQVDTKVKDREPDDWEKVHLSNSKADEDNDDEYEKDEDWDIIHEESWDPILDWPGLDEHTIEALDEDGEIIVE